MINIFTNIAPNFIMKSMPRWVSIYPNCFVLEFFAFPDNFRVFFPTICPSKIFIIILFVHHSFPSNILIMPFLKAIWAIEKIPAI